MIEALRRDRFVVVSVNDGTIYEVRDHPEDAEQVEKRKIRGGSSRYDWFDVPRGQFDMYARMGFHFVMRWYVTDGEYTRLLDEIADMSESGRIALAKEKAITPPE